jgi:hypothetical protein
MAGGFLIRSRYAEDCLAQGATRGLQQYLILGAGLDTFAYRQPNWAKALVRLITSDNRRLRCKSRGPMRDRLAPFCFSARPVCRLEHIGNTMPYSGPAFAYMQMP